MYGLVNKAIQDMVCSRFGEETWKQIKHKAEVDVDVFLSMEGYPDDITHKLVKAASVVLSLSPKQIMQAFGEFWVQYTAQEGYGEMMDMSGDTLPEFLENLDNLHARVGVSFPKLQPPSFECTDMEENSLSLHYRSDREGLTPMVIGLIKGLGTRFDTEVHITQTLNRDEGAEHDEFLVIYKPN
ncbi:heme NO-binding protein [Nostoc sp. 'Peltigera membranacea cyanobiont' 213]|uniref:heme NO-binding domain-containing protein n=1 Tax=unclassified Nostoc TaxID=2593658 RepID=UPI000B9532BD|nr:MULTISPECIES: heme NO-binding domain-containing protein [unclassified Nostoc]AVH65972.1 Heme NO binding (HNOB) domain protein [Nostoc sp. 'Peltigera membranacea cyanobiont' N6]OYD98939.1 heme NO-binding protein [Nostoc sp. 'Peltigera membranacea cyanobiont' 213]OYE05430.1 heme NO-binding protein [Nostoc sp. 'Peltigera membranacea cyanobiont' 232]